MRNEHTHSLKMLLRTFKAHEHLGYNAFAVMADGGVLCPYCALSEYRLILSATRSNDRHSGWNYYGCDINWEDTSLYCDHCSGHIPAAYVEDEE